MGKNYILVEILGFKSSAVILRVFFCIFVIHMLVLQGLILKSLVHSAFLHGGLIKVYIAKERFQHHITWKS